MWDSNNKNKQKNFKSIYKTRSLNYKELTDILKKKLKG